MFHVWAEQNSNPEKSSALNIQVVIWCAEDPGLAGICAVSVALSISQTSTQCAQDPAVIRGAVQYLCSLQVSQNMCGPSRNCKEANCALL